MNGKIISNMMAEMLNETYTYLESRYEGIYSVTLIDQIAYLNRYIKSFVY